MSEPQHRLAHNPFITPVTCPECGQIATATWEETEDLAEAITPKSVSTGFKIEGNAVLCIDCGVEALAISNQTSG
jgi:hypothetical protein